MDTSLASLLDEQIARRIEALIAIRRDLHAHPQPAFAETYAADVVARELALAGVSCETGLAKTGVVGWILPVDQDAASRPACGLRADMDALPIQEATGLSYQSAHPGYMHACGHDGHTTILIGAAQVLAGLRDKLTAPIKLIFQPAEEVGGGADRIIAAGALDRRTGGLTVASVFSLHNWPDLPLGTFAATSGAFLAGTDLFDITVVGRGGHGAMPQLARDPILAAAHLVLAIQSLVSRRIAPVQPAVVSIGSIQAGHTENVIPDRVRLGGTLRYLDVDVQRTLHRGLEELTAGITASLGCQGSVDLRVGYPPTVNHPQGTALFQEAAKRAGLRQITLNQPLMVAEDFAFYGRQVPAAYALVGSRHRDPKGTAALHSPGYDFNDDMLAPAIRLMCQVALGSPRHDPANER